MSQMRLALQHARHHRNQKIIDNDKFPRKNIGTSEEAFNMGTIAGARAIRMESQIGSLAVGKLADIVIFDSTSPTMICAAQHDPVTAVVRHSTIRDVNTVIIDGVVRKRGGVLLPVNLDAQQEISKSHSRVGDISWEETAEELIESRERVAFKLSQVDIEAGGEDFKSLAGIDSSVLV
ncbi:hypothetical protein FDECE_13784 [Fusarium decemcellulare]|nr:hypothetical protein FDECE_13784 [Fusarium decemcellulare]